MFLLIQPRSPRLGTGWKISIHLMFLLIQHNSAIPLVLLYHQSLAKSLFLPLFYQVNYTYFFSIKKMQKFFIFTSFLPTFPPFGPGKNSQNQILTCRFISLSYNILTKYIIIHQFNNTNKIFFYIVYLL